MEPLTHRVLGLVRAGAASLTVLALTTGAHVLGGGALPTWSALLALASLVLMVLSVLGRWRLQLRTLVPVLAALQALLHGALSILPARGAITPVSASARHPHLLPLSSDPGAVVTSAATDVAHNAHAMPLTTGMLVAHAVATLTTAVLLVGADRAARAALHWATSVLPLLLEPRRTPATTSARGRAGVVTAHVRRLLVPLGSVTRRGPPELLAPA